MIAGCQFNIAPPMDPQYIPVAEKHYRNYFERNREDLDIVEGVWTEYVVGSLYEDGKLIQRKEIPQKARWVVIKKGAQYQILNEYGEQNKFVASFKPTRDKNIFTFDCLFLQSKDHIRVKATLIEGKRIEMAYDAPEGIFAEHYSEFMGEALKSDPAKTLQLYWQFNWLKTFPK
jgi:hypothetical protein